ncbi:MAG TPA: aldehyde ferredoxin oxidoreductase N-terminal domain-containing protein, partial [bacterium]|nr:aldehyde ferredoxin oxidoreductase N-terminal domain-containing protein [bacterium]
MSKTPCEYGGYTGRILRVDLARRTWDVEPTAAYLPHGIGGRGIAAEIAWNEISAGCTAFDPIAPLIIMTGPLTGTMAPFSGRTTICGLAPQGYPHEWYTRSSFGGHWGPELKYAGFDGVVITGRADTPVYLEIEDGDCRIRDARPLWGRGLIDAQKRLIDRLGPRWRIFSIGPAGENRVRVAVAATETESASGQGGFGALMGAKHLKAIAVRGTGSLRIADPDRFEQVCTLIREEAHGSHGWPHTPRLDPEMVRKYGQRFQACTQGCAVRCYDARFYTRVPSKLCRGKYLAGQIDCIAGLFPGFPGSFYNWNLGFEAGFEMAQLTNDEGLNHWELLVGTMPWLRYLRADGSLRQFGRHPIDLDDIHFWKAVILGISRRDGDLGDALAEGTVRGARRLGIGGDRLDQLFPAWGYAGHWDGHGDHINRIFFPFWIVAALQWAMDTRDPISSGHGYVQNIMGWCREHSPVHGLDWPDIMRVTRRVYGSDAAADPRSGYAAKAYPAYWHGQRSVAKDSLPVDDQIFPRILSKKTEDHFARAGDLEGPQFEYAMFRAATGINWTESEYEHHLERVIQRERQLLIRNFRRSRTD